MKKILLDENKNYYKANLHCHSTYSDGKMSVSELKEHYMRAGYSVIAFSDHEHIVDNSSLSDENFLAITAAEVAIKEAENSSTRRNLVMKVCHLNLLSRDPHNTLLPVYSSVYDHFINENVTDKLNLSGIDYKREYSGKGISELIKTANEAGFLVTYNHPRWSLETAQEYMGYKGLFAVEVYNHGCAVDGMYEYDINVYDDILRGGERVACVMTDDNHKPEDTLGGYTVINSDKLDYESIIRALEEHNFYCSQAPVIHSLYVEDGYAFITFSGGVYATMSTDTRKCMKIENTSAEGRFTAKFPIFEGVKYIRFDVVDGQGRRANTNAYFTDSFN